MKLLIEVEVELTNERREMIKKMHYLQQSTQLQIIEDTVEKQLFKNDSMESMIVRAKFDEKANEISD